MARPDKEAAVAALADKFRQADAVLLTEYRGLSVAQLKELRRSLAGNAEYTVVKNTLAAIAARQVGLEDFADDLTGPSALTFVTGEPVEAAKALRDFAKDNQQLVIKGGVMDGAVLSADGVDKLASLESREVLLAKLAGGVAVIKVGAATEVELKERKHRIEDAVRNAKAAVDEGIVPGGGVALIQAGEKAFSGLNLEGDEATGANIVKVAIEAPLKQIALNAGMEPGVVVDKVRGLEPGFGLNAATGEYVNLLEDGVNDPVKVTRSALQNAASIAGLFLTTEAVVADIPEKTPEMPGADQMGGMGMM